MHTLETLRKTYDSYMEAVEILFGIFSELQLRGSGYTHRIGDSFDGYCSPDNVGAANSCRINVDTLFDMGRPRRVEPAHYIWKSSFITIELCVTVPYTTYHSAHKEGDRQDSISVYFHKRGFGMKNWPEQKANLRQLAGDCSPSVKKQIIEAVESADADVQGWIAAVRVPPVPIDELEDATPA